MSVSDHDTYKELNEDSVCVCARARVCVCNCEDDGTSPIVFSQSRKQKN